MKKFALVTLVYLLEIVTAIQDCCPDPNNNKIVNKTCIDGNKIRDMGCDTYFIMEKTEGQIENGALIFETMRIKPEKYCLTKDGDTDTESYIVCYEEQEEDSYTQIYPIFLIISIVFLVLTIGIYLGLPNLLDTEGICILHSLASLSIAYIVLCILDLKQNTDVAACQILGYIMYFTFCYSFFWLNILSFHIWKVIVKRKFCMEQNHTRLLNIIYHIYGICGPLFMLFILILAHKSNMTIFKNTNPRIGDGLCWFPNFKLTLMYFYGPVSVLLISNIFFYIWTIVYICNQRMFDTNDKKAKVFRFKLILCIKLFFIMGITWIFEIISAATENYSDKFKYIWIVTDTLNGLQGLLIFLILVVFRKRVIRELANRTICCIRMPNGWKTVKDDECEEIRDEEMNLSAKY